MHAVKQHELIPLGYDPELQAELVVRRESVVRATMRAAEVALSVRNVAAAFVDRQNRAHQVLLGGVAFTNTLQAVFWSSPQTDHARYIRDTGSGSLMPFDSAGNKEYLRFKAMDMREVPPDETEAYLGAINAARDRHQLTAREVAQFSNPRQQRRLYVATPSLLPGLTTVPVGAYYAPSAMPGEWTPADAWAKDVHYPADQVVLQTALDMLQPEPERIA